MNRVFIRSIDIEKALRDGYEVEPACRVVEHDGRAFAHFSSGEKTVIDITAIARQIGERLS